MAVQIIHKGSDWNQDLYDKTFERAVPDRSSPPAGMLVHVAAPLNGGWCVTEVWESEQAWESFRDGTLVQVVQEIQGPPFDTEINQVHNSLIGDVSGL